MEKENQVMFQLQDTGVINLCCCTADVVMLS